MEDFENIDLDLNAEDQIEPVKVAKKSTKKVTAKSTVRDEDELINCLRNERITVKFIPREKTGITDKHHPFYGGLADGAVITLVLPVLRNGSYKNPLTRDEKNYLEYVLGLESNALSIHNSKDNYWENYQVRLSKEDYVLDLSTPKGYIDYKVLLANTDYVAPSIEELNNNDRETYRFVLISDKEVLDTTSSKVKSKEKCMELYLAYKDDLDTLRCIIQTVTGRPVDPKTQIDFLKGKCAEQIELDPIRFLKILEDPYLPAKVIVTRAVDANIITKRGTWHYYEGTPMCDNNEEPTFTIAAKYLANKKNQEIKFSIENKLK